MSKQLISKGDDFIVEWFDRSFGGSRRTVFQALGIDGSMSIGNGAVTIDPLGAVNISKATITASPTLRKLYISTTGNDGNPGTFALPMRTPRAAWLKATTGRWGGRNQIVAAAGTYTLDTANGISYAGAMGVEGNGSPISIVGDVTDEQGTRTVTSASATGTVFTDSTLSMTTDEYVGATILCVTGANAGRRAHIRSNDATSLTLQNKFPNAISIGNTFKIQRPSVIFTIPAASSAIFGHTNGYIGLKNIKFSFTASTSTLVVVDGASVCCEGVEMAMNGGSIIVNGFGRLLNPSTGPWAQDLTNNPFSSLRACGVFFNGGSGGSILVGNQAVLGGPAGAGLHVFSSVLTSTLGAGSRIQLQNPIGVSSGFSLTNNSYLQITDGNAGALPGAFSAPPAFASLTSPIILSNGSYADISQLALTNMTGPCIKVDKLSRATLVTVTGTTGNTDVGLQVTSMSQIKQTTCTVTGVTGDTRVNAALKLYSELPFTDTDTLNRIE
jgi:hypothetical protein